MIGNLCLHWPRFGQCRKSFFTGLVFCIGIAFYSCSGGSVIDKIPEDGNYITHFSRFLSGIPAEWNSPFADLSKTKIFHNHKIEIDSLWKKIQSQNLEKISAFSKEHISASKDSFAAIYPFSGADILNPLFFYPDADTYILMALEKPGHLTDPLALSGEALQSSLKSIRIAMSEIALRNYFTRRMMRSEFTTSKFSGTLPLFIVFLTKAGYPILSIDKVYIDQEGELKSVCDSVFGRETDGLRIVFETNGKKKKLVYISVALKNSEKLEEYPVGKYLQKFPRIRTHIKSAEYLFYRKGFLALQDYILKRSDAIVQDDTGILYKDIDKTIWDVKLFGSFNGPFEVSGIKMLPSQLDLVQEFKKFANPLEFHFGYGIVKGRKSSIQLYLRKKAE